jgi:hypothetical protein
VKVPPRSHATAEAQRAFNLREKAAYHSYVAAHGPVRGGQKGFRRLMRIRPVSQRPLSLLSPMQRSKRETAFRVLGRSRRFGEPLSKAARDAHTTPGTVRRYLGRSGYRKIGGRYRPTRSDTFVRRMAFYEDGRRRTVTVRGSKTASQIGKYNRDVRSFLEDPARDDSVLKWEGRTFVDARGQVHTFETDPARILSAVERAESETGAFDIYPDGDESEEALAEA